MKYLKYIILIFSISTIIGCQDDILNSEPYSFLSDVNFYKTDAQAEAAIAAVYSVFTRQTYYGERSWLMFDLAGDDMRPRQPWQGGQNRRHFFDRYIVDSSIPWFDAYYRDAYQVIAFSNAILDNVERNSEIKTIVVGEALFLRAMAYFDLVRAFGGVPLITTLEGLDLTNLNQARASEEEIFNRIEMDLLEASSLLPEISAGYAGSQFEGRATQGSSLAMLARVHLFQNEYSETQTYAQQVMNLGYSLYEDYADIFSPVTQNGTEHVYSIQFDCNVVGTGPQQRSTDLAPRNSSFMPGGGLTQDRVEDQFFQLFPDDYRKEVSILDYDAPPGNASDGDPNIEVPHVWKFIDPTACDFRASSVNLPIIRYSDVLLMYAEATNELSGPTAEAIEAVNMVRRRARGVGTINERDASVLPDIEFNVSQTDFRELILSERHFEFCFEGQRYYDLRRTDRFLDMLRANFPDEAIDFNRGGLYPLPQTALDRNGLLEQNPGY